jgi:hypothetical protein
LLVFILSLSSLSVSLSLSFSLYLLSFSWFKLDMPSDKIFQQILSVKKHVNRYCLLTATSQKSSILVHFLLPFVMLFNLSFILMKNKQLLPSNQISVINVQLSETVNTNFLKVNLNKLITKIVVVFHFNILFSSFNFKVVQSLYEPSSWFIILEKLKIKSQGLSLLLSDDTLREWIFKILMREKIRERRWRAFSKKWRKEKNPKRIV